MLPQQAQRPPGAIMYARPQQQPGLMVPGYAPQQYPPQQQHHLQYGQAPPPGAYYPAPAPGQGQQPMQAPPGQHGYTGYGAPPQGYY
jgi:hypothetical protein